LRVQKSRVLSALSMLNVKFAYQSEFVGAVIFPFFKMARKNLSEKAFLLQMMCQFDHAIVSDF
jgi:hypothetical protein